MNRALLCRQVRSTHPLALFLQQIYGGVRRVFMPIAPRRGRDEPGGFTRGGAGDDLLGTQYQALPPHTWPYNHDVGLAITKQVQALVGVPRRRSSTPPRTCTTCSTRSTSACC